MKLQRYFGSMAGRLFLFLLIGVIGSAILALSLADAQRRADLRRINLEYMVDRLQDFITLINSAPQPLRGQIMSKGIPGVHQPVGTEKIEKIDADLTQMLALRIGSGSHANKAVPSSCISQPSAQSFYSQFNCWVISIRLADHSEATFVAFSPHTDSLNVRLPSVVFLSILTIGVGLLAYFASRMAATPLRDLSRAARALGGDLDRSPLIERGPYEVRDAIRAFNAMHTQLRNNVVERTRILASITHDLQTPLTRLRLRAEKVEDIALRSRLIDDVDGMEVLIEQGLEFFRGNAAEEPFDSVALDSLLESVVENAAVGGRRAFLVQRSGYDVEARPNELQRCLANLLDNALKHGGGAEVYAAMEDGAIRIRIRDFGPGIPPEKLESVLEPFVRLETSLPRAVRGLGLGLTIAKTLAENSDAELILANHPEGGLEVSLILRRKLVANAHVAPDEPGI